MQQFFIAIILVLGLGCWWLYSENETLKANNLKLEYAVEEQKQTIATIKESYEKQGEALMNMTRENALIEHVERPIPFVEAGDAYDVFHDATLYRCLRMPNRSSSHME